MSNNIKSNLPKFNSLSDLKPKNSSKVARKAKRKTTRKGGGKSTIHKSIQKKGAQSNSATQKDSVSIEQAATTALVKGDIVTAKRLYDNYISLNPDKAKASAFSNRGIVHAKLGDIRSAIEDFKKAVALNPDYASAYSNLANAYLSMQQINMAHDAIQHALRLNPDNYNANFNHFIILSKIKKYPEALKAIKQLFKKFPEQIKKVDPSPFIDIKKQVCDWDGIELLEEQSVNLLENKDFIAKWALVHVNNHALDGWQQKRVLSNYVHHNYGHLTRFNTVPNKIVPNDNTLDSLEPNKMATDDKESNSKRKIRVAYVSSDFYDHATLRLMAQVFESHDHSQFEWYAISHSKHDDSAILNRVKASFDHFVDINDWTDEQVSNWMREQKIDIAIDLKGHTGGSRLGIFARGCAPMQMTYLGFPGTTGAEFMDYIIGDKWVTPFDSQDQFSETILQLPHCYQPNDRHRYLPKQATSNVNDADYQQWRHNKREEEGLPKDAIVLCCFNNTYKLHPSVFEVWMRLLKSHPKAVLWLLADKPLTETNLRNYAQEYGVEDSRIIFAPRTAQKEYLTRYLLADLFVDTLAYNAHTTGSDALWIGLPLVTLAGSSFASRVGASLLDTVGLPELITYSLAEYEQKIDDLCAKPDKLKEYSQYLRDIRDTSPLFDAKQMARNLEALYLPVL